MLASWEITQNRATMVSSFPDTVIVQAYSSADDGQGGRTDTYTPQAATTGRIEELHTPHERVEGGQVTAIAQWRCLVAWGTTVGQKDRMSVNGIVYEVTDTAAIEQERAELVVYLRRLL